MCGRRSCAVRGSACRSGRTHLARSPGGKPTPKCSSAPGRRRPRHIHEAQALRAPSGPCLPGRSPYTDASCMTANARTPVRKDTRIPFSCGILRVVSAHITGSHLSNILNCDWSELGPCPVPYSLNSLRWQFFSSVRKQSSPTPSTLQHNRFLQLSGEAGAARKRTHITSAIVGHSPGGVHRAITVTLRNVNASG